MTTYEFTLVLKDVGELTDQLADHLFETGCDDSSPATCDGIFSIDFHRAARSLEEAIRTAIAQVQSLGLAVDRVEIEADFLAVLA